MFINSFFVFRACMCLCWFRLAQRCLSEIFLLFSFMLHIRLFNYMQTHHPNSFLMLDFVANFGLNSPWLTDFFLPINVFLHQYKVKGLVSGSILRCTVFERGSIVIAVAGLDDHVLWLPCLERAIWNIAIFLLLPKTFSSFMAFFILRFFRKSVHHYYMSFYFFLRSVERPRNAHGLSGC